VGDHLVHLTFVAPMGHGLLWDAEAARGGLGFSVQVARPVVVVLMGHGFSVQDARAVAVASMGQRLLWHVRVLRPECRPFARPAGLGAISPTGCWGG
jgi:hypothetical protein